MKKYLKISSFRNMNIKVIMNDNDTIYEGIIEECPQEIKDMLYSKVILNSNITTIYTYNDKYKEK